jgi:hypothetical protein
MQIERCLTMYSPAASDAASRTRAPTASRAKSEILDQEGDGRLDRRAATPSNEWIGRIGEGEALRSAALTFSAASGEKDDGAEQTCDARLAAAFGAPHTGQAAIRSDPGG